MNATTISQDRIRTGFERNALLEATQELAPLSSRQVLAGPLYRFHGLRVLDADGQAVGIVDWIWGDERGRGEFIGVQLRWLRGTARAIPADRLQIDMQSSTIRVAYRKEQIARAPRFAIDRALTAEGKRGVRSHYSLHPAALPGLAVAA